jgi:hypothetical protein
MTGTPVAARFSSRDLSSRRTAPAQTLLWAWSGALAVLIASAGAWSVRNGAGDWHVVASAGARVGTPQLQSPPEAWQSFFYLPGAAWALAPFAQLPLATSFLLNAVLMLACAAAAGLIAARTNGLDRTTAVGMYALWSPVVYAAAIIGQNAPFGLLLTQIAIAGMARGSVALTAIPIGILFYKPTYALPMIALLIVRSRWRELAVIAATTSIWYGISVTANGGDWDWLSRWTHLLANFAAGDFSVNAPFAISLPALMIRTGASATVAAVAATVVALVAAIALRKASRTEAGSAAALIGLALSPHAWAYDAVLALPMIAFITATLTEHTRTRLLLGIAFITPLFFASRQLGFDALAFIVIGGAIAWCCMRLRSTTEWKTPEALRLQALAPRR